MCSIIAGFNKEDILDLASLNEYRGTHSHSIAAIDRNTYKLKHLDRTFGAINFDSFELPTDNDFYIVHQQAPTTENKSSDNIHPAEFIGHYLYHNGIIKNKEIERLRVALGTSFTWDTKLILMQMIKLGDPNNIDGSFACLYIHNDGIWLFRNEIAPLFYSDTKISSTKFENSISLPSNRIYSLKFNSYNTIRLVKEAITFTTVENPYYFGE